MKFNAVEVYTPLTSTAQARGAASAASCPLPCTSPAGGYARREPEKTALHLVVREHLETFLATVLEERGKDLPRYVEEEFRRYLRYGILAHGFLRVVCPRCRQEIVVAHSSKCRGACPSCSARRMCGPAAHLTDHVLPADVPVRQCGAVTFHEGQAPSRGDIAAVAARVEKRMTRWLRRRGLVDERAAEERSSGFSATVRARRSAWSASRSCPTAASRTCSESHAAMARRTS